MADEVLKDCKETAVQIIQEIIRHMNDRFREDKQTRKALGLSLKEKDRPPAESPELLPLPPQSARIPHVSTSAPKSAMHFLTLNFISFSPFLEFMFCLLALRLTHHADQAISGTKKPARSAISMQVDKAILTGHQVYISIIQTVIQCQKISVC